MKSTVTKIALDVTKLGSQVEVPMFRGDTKRTLVFSLTENGKPYNLEDCFVAFTGEKADGNFLNNICDVDIEKQVAIYDLDKDDNHRQTTTCEGPVKCQLVIYKNDSRVASACFNLLVMKTIYNEEEILDSETALGFYAKSTDLLDYVLKTRAIAGIDLQDDITAEQLQTALSTYPVLTTSNIDDINQNTKAGQFAILVSYDGKTYTRDLYYGFSDTNVQLIAGYTFNANTVPKIIEKYLDDNSIDFDSFVSKTLKIADIDLQNDITAEELQTALNTYPILTSSSMDFIQQNIKKGQLAIYTNYDGKTYTRDIYYGYFDGGAQLIAGTTFNNNMFPEAIKNYLDENPVVPTTRKIADLDLSEDITADQLYNNLGVKPHEISYPVPTKTTTGQMGQIYTSIQDKNSYILSSTSNSDDEPEFKWDKISNPDILTSVDSSSTDEQVPSAKLLHSTTQKTTSKIDEIATKLRISFNLYNGLSEKWAEGKNYIPGVILNIKTLELTSVRGDSTRVLSKAVPIKASTEYISPYIGYSTIIAYGPTGSYIGTRTQSEDGTITTGNSDAYLVFSFNKNSYTDYANFYIKEVIEQVDYIEAPTTAEVGQALVVKSVDDSGKPVEWEAIDTVSPERIDDLEGWVGDLEGAFGNGVPYVDTAEVGQVISVAQVNEDGMPIVWEAVDLPNGDESENSIEIDTTLTVAGAAADAKAVGDKLDFLRKYNGWIDTNTGVYIDTTAKTLTFGANSYVTYGNQLFNVSNTTHDISTMIGGAWVYLDISSSPYKLTKDRNTSYVILLGALWKPNHLADFHMDKTKLFVDGMPVSYTGRYHNKTINCLGDSMTEGVGTTKAYHQWFGQLCGFKTINNYGLGGSCIAPIGNNDPAWTGEENIQSFYERYSSMSSADVITVFGGVNDWSTGRELGTIEDTTSNTFYGAMKLLCEGLIAKYPTSDIFVFSSPQCDYINRPANKLSGTQWAGNTEGYNRKGYKLQDYANAMGEVCAIYGITFTNLTNNLFYGLSGVLGDHNGNSGAYGSDALHPNAEGHKKIALKMASVINSGVGSV